MIALILALQVLTPLTGERNLTPESGNQVCGSLASHGLTYSGSNRGRLRLLSSDLSPIGGFTRLDGSATITEDDTLAADGGSAWSHRYIPGGGMASWFKPDVGAAFDCFPSITTTAWQPDICRRLGQPRWLIVVAGGWDERCLLVEVGSTGPTSPIRTLSAVDGNSHNYVTVAENRLGIWTVFRRHAGATSPDLWGRYLDRATLQPVGQPYPVLRPSERAGDQTWPMIRAGRGLHLVYQHRDTPSDPWEIRVATFTATGRRIGGTIELGLGRDPVILPLAGGKMAVGFRQEHLELAMLAILSARGAVLHLGPANVTPTGPRPDSLTDRPSLRKRPGVLDMTWMDQNPGPRTLKGRAFALTLP